MTSRWIPALAAIVSTPLRASILAFRIDLRGGCGDKGPEMKGTTQTLLVFGALLAFGLAPGTSSAQSASVPTPRPGVSDFRLSYGPLGPIGPVVRASAESSSQQLRPGVSDFGLLFTWPLHRRSTAQATRQAPAGVETDGFDWGDAGVGAAAMLGTVFLLGGFGAWLVHRSRELRNA
jgi:hypothetical protein